MDFKEIKMDQRPVPFWSWNEKLTPEETKRQVRLMHDAGIGGFFMHARGGLATEYMSEEWFQNVEAAIEQAEELGMNAWAYDENGWPSGFGDGKVNGLGVQYQQKYLRMQDDEPTENVICKNNGHWFYYDINPFYVDTLSHDAIEEFIKVSYQPYYDRFKNRIVGFFTDEPQISRNGIPWSFEFEREYNERYGENINDRLEELFLPVGDYKNTRMKFWKMVTDMFSQNFMKQIYDWCSERGLKLTGHLVLEEDLEIQLTANGACMPHYEYFHVPGMDWLGRNIYDCLTQKQLTSVCEQLGKDAVLSETFALCGHNVSFDELKGIYEWQMVRGINLLCQHLEGYSMRGQRKRDYPPAMYSQQPWWDVYDRFNETVSRTGAILAGGKKSAEVLVLHPQTTAWTMFDNDKNEGITELHKAYIKILRTLEQKHIEFHLGDEIIMERHARVENGKIIIGCQEYSRLIVDLCDTMFDSTKSLIEEFVKGGGEIVTAFDLSPNQVTDNPDIAYTKRIYDGFNVHYFVNTSAEKKYAKINLNGHIIDAGTGDLIPFAGEYEFAPWDSVLICEDGTDNIEKNDRKETVIVPEGEFGIVSCSGNTLTLDKCDYYFDGELQEKNGYVLNICERANKLEKMVKIHQDYHVTANYVPGELYLVCETPENFEISVNGNKIEKNIKGFFRDRSFREIDIAKYMVKGENTISFDCDFVQSDAFYDNLKKSFIFESEKNKLCYDMEIEAIYLLGDFAVGTDGEWTELPLNAKRYKGDFTIEAPKKKIKLSDIEMQGYPFFSGNLTVEKEIEVTADNSVMELKLRGINAFIAEINGKSVTYMGSRKIYLDDFGANGNTKVKLTFFNNLRNLLGPHHLKVGECLGVCPSHFYKESCVWNEHPEKDWDDDYCFVDTGVYND